MSESHKDKNKEEGYLSEEQKKCILDLYKFGKEIANLRKRPLIVMFYSKEDDGGIGEDDLYELENKLEQSIPEGIKEMDICIQTSGGDANTSYRIAQLLREYCYHLETLIPNYAYSGGTLISLASNKILMGRTGVISPIDLQLSYNSKKISPFALVDIEKYIDFLVDTCNKIDFNSEENKAQFMTSLSKGLVEEHGTRKLGELFRMRTLTELHAKILLQNYMFKNMPNKRQMIEHVIKSLTSESPAHDFEIDYNIAKKGMHLVIEQMDRNLYKLTRHLMNTCKSAKELGLICGFINSDERKPYFEVFLPDTKLEEIKNE